MSTWNEKNLIIRQSIISAAKTYKGKLAGKVFLYVYDNSYFEVAFLTSSFKHLTGVNSVLGAEDFYKKAADCKLTVKQFFYDAKHPYKSVCKKLPCLNVLPDFTSSEVCVVVDYPTVNVFYKLGVTNLNFTIGLTENMDEHQQKINDWFIPRTLRVNDHSVERSSDAEFIDFIFSKDASLEKYTDVTYAERGKMVPESVKGLLSKELLEQLNANAAEC